MYPTYLAQGKLRPWAEDLLHHQGLSTHLLNSAQIRPLSPSEMCHLLARPHPLGTLETSQKPIIPSPTLASPLLKIVPWSPDPLAPNHYFSRVAPVPGPAQIASWTSPSFFFLIQHPLSWPSRGSPRGLACFPPPGLCLCCSLVQCTLSCPHFATGDCSPTFRSQLLSWEGFHETLGCLKLYLPLRTTVLKLVSTRMVRRLSGDQGQDLVTTSPGQQLTISGCRSHKGPGRVRTRSGLSGTLGSEAQAAC